MMTKRKREHAARMRARRGVRPWDHTNQDEAERFIVHMRRMFERGCSDEFIANALSLNMPLVQVLRNKRDTQG